MEQLQHCFEFKQVPQIYSLFYFFGIIKFHSKLKDDNDSDSFIWLFNIFIVIIKKFSKVMSKLQANGFNIQIIDYRNARYQGAIDSGSNKPNGFGIVLDDSMNVYCSEWRQGLMDGMTFIYFTNGDCLYGQWKQGLPHGINVFRNKEFAVYASFMKGRVYHEAIVINEQVSRITVLNGESLMSNTGSSLQFISSQRIIDVQYFSEVLMYTSQKIELGLEKYELTLYSYLTQLSSKYSDIVKLTSINSLHYFGFQNGLGFNFSIQGKGLQKMKMISVGHHNRERLTQIGTKYHQLTCIEEGNFTAKETITYNRRSERPVEKCQLIFQNVHRRSLNFMNHYWDLKGNPMYTLNSFMANTFSKKFHQIEEEPKHAKEIPTERQQFYKNAKQDYLKAANGIINKIKSKQNRSSLTKSKSHVRLKQKRVEEAIPVKKVEVIKFPRNHRWALRNKSESNFDKQESLHKLVENFKKLEERKEPKCQRCKQKEKRSKQKRSLTKNRKSVEGKKDISPAKQIKYLKFYQNEERNTDKKEVKISKTSVSAQPSHHVRQTADKNERKKSCYKLQDSHKKKDQTQYHNQMKIREEIYQEQRDHQVRDQFQNCRRNLEREYLQPLHIQANFSPSQRRYLGNIKSFSNYYIPAYQLQPNSQYEQLQMKRQKILKDFRKMNSQLNFQPIVPRSYYQFTEEDIGIRDSPLRKAENSSMMTELVSSRKRIVEIDKQNRQRIEDFNKRFRGLLQQPQNLTNKAYKMNQQGLNRCKEVVNQPRMTSVLGCKRRQEDLLERAGRKPQYKYYFD